ncbi:hypothetical protein MSAN_02204800 [Mycena sanguinolenta]|uniref:Uncharacterized protein n=1 Tax=Mycena sanguinolenta TaxID=230812 RepID=A0A8H6XE20_9AGAR|nr:hypothetical protein MSAN_02204800 [Mycena sanguinolenta]
MSQSILRPAAIATESELPACRAQRVAFHTDRASKPISKIELTVFKEEWGMFKRPRPLGTKLARLDVLDRSFDTARSQFGAGWDYFTRRVVDAKVRPRIRTISSPKPLAKAGAPTDLWLHRRPRLNREQQHARAKYSNSRWRERITGN